MRVIEITQHGGPEVLQIRERPMPDFKPGEVVIKVHAAGVNRPDVFQRSGNYAPHLAPRIYLASKLRGKLLMEISPIRI